MNTHEMVEKWILDETALSPEESLQMKEHLAECHRCYCLYQNLKGSLTCIKQAPEKKPAPGFSVRWQQQMILRTKEKEKTDLIHRILKVSALISVLSISSCLVFFLPGNLIKTALYISDLFKIYIGSDTSIGNNPFSFQNSFTVYRYRINSPSVHLYNRCHAFDIND